METFLDRTLPILQGDGLEKLSRPLISIAGLGGVGGGTFLNLVRCGVKRFRLAENGVFDPPDMNRQIAAFASTMDHPKIEVYAELAREINPNVEIDLYPEGTTVDNIEAFLDGSDVYVGVIDAEKGQDVKAMSSGLIEKFHVPLFTAGVIGFGAIMVAHEPEGMMPGEFWAKVAEKSRDDGGLLPSFIADHFDETVMTRIKEALKSGKVPTTGVGGALSGTILASEVLCYLLRDTDLVKREVVFAPRFTVVDLLRPALEVLDVNL